jgi:hypothetical protein
MLSVKGKATQFEVNDRNPNKNDRLMLSVKGKATLGGMVETIAHSIQGNV